MTPYLYHPHPLAGLGLMIVVWFVQLIIAFFIYRDAKEQKMLAPVWTILAVIPVLGYLSDMLYLVLREFRYSMKEEKPPASL